MPCQERARNYSPFRKGYPELRDKFYRSSLLG
ncbi:unnamed protein product [Leptidea sinapis]|uniref:Uncharacterized protein n=1 Tax=Leptidea sinapis TaxID=189913 RepID=A0A5E4Q1P3_9NEOP|nr:unnamed protein product [Leptidea sinapis]